MNASLAAVTEPPRLPTQRPVAAVGLFALAGGALFLGADGWKFGALFAVGGQQAGA